MKYIILFLLYSVISLAQAPPKNAIHEPDLIDPEIVPQFKGGNRALTEYIRDSIKNKAFISPEEYHILKPAYARFTVTETGKVTNTRIIRSSNIPRIDSLFKSGIEKMPDWLPGSFEGKSKSVELNLPLKFELKQ